MRSSASPQRGPRMSIAPTVQANAQTSAWLETRAKPEYFHPRGYFHPICSGAM